MVECVIPEVDLDCVKENWRGERRQEVAVQLGAALREKEICHVINHGIPLELIEELRIRSSDFFRLPIEEKEKYYAANLEQSEDLNSGVQLFREGLTPIDKTNKLWPCCEFRESLVFYTRPVTRRRDYQWPSSLRKSLIEYSDAVHTLCLLLLELLSESLGLQPGALKDGLGPKDLQMLTFNNYTVQENPSVETLGLSSHIDTSVFTVQPCSEVSGLQVLENDVWTTVRPIRGAIVVQPGVFLEVLSNGIFKARNHRVISPKASRIGIVSGYRISTDTVVRPLPQLLDRNSPALFLPVSAMDYVKRSRENGILGGDHLGHFKIKNGQQSPPNPTHSNTEE